MIDRYVFIMPKTALFALLIIYGNIIPAGQSAELCPKYPLGVSSSISGIIVSTIVTSEKLVDGFFSYFYYLGENSFNQIIGINDWVGNIFFKYSNKITDFVSKVFDGIVEQAQSIYGASSGIFRSIIDSVIKLENSLQSYTYNKISNIVDVIRSGRITTKIGEEIIHPVDSIKKTLSSLKLSLISFITTLKTTLKGGVGSLEGDGLIKQIEEAAVAPLKATKEFLYNSTVILKTVTSDAVSKFKGFIHQLEKGSISEKLSASLASPVVAIQEVWTLFIKSSASIKSSISTAAVGLVHPLLGSTLTRQLSKLTNLPFDITQGIWNSIKGWTGKIDDFVASITGGGTLSERINVVLSHPLYTLKNTWSSTITTTKDIIRFFIGDKATDQLGAILSSPLSILNGFTSAITGGGSLGELLNKLISKPTAFITGVWNSIKLSIQTFTTSIAGEGFSDKLITIISAPGHFISDLISSITGGGHLSEQISNIFTKPWTTIKSTLNGTFNSIKNLLYSITGGGNLGEDIENLFSKPLATLKNVWNSSINSIKGLLSSITGGGSISLKLNSILTKPIDTVKSIWNGTENAIESATKSIFGGNISGTISKVLNSPISLLNGLLSSFTGGGSISITSPITTIKKIWKSTFGGLFSSLLGGKGSISGEAGLSTGGSTGIGGSVSVSGGGGGGISGAIGSIVKAPGGILKDSLDVVKRGENSIVGGLKGIFNKIPIIGNGGSSKAGVDINYGGSGGGKSSGSGGSKISWSGGSKGSSSGGSKSGGSVESQSSSSGGNKGGVSGGIKIGGSGGSKSGNSGQGTNKGGGSFSAGGSFSTGGSS